MNQEETELLRKEMALLMNERHSLLRVVGAAAVLVANSNAMELQPGVLNASEVLSELLNSLPDETFKDALDSVQAQCDYSAARTNT